MKVVHLTQGKCIYLSLYDKTLKNNGVHNMKKFLIAILITVAVSTAVLGATSNDIQKGIYLRQDVFEAKMDAFIAEIRLMNQQLRS